MARSTVIAIGCWLWATMTSLFALTHSLAVAMPICAINGVGARGGPPCACSAQHSSKASAPLHMLCSCKCTLPAATCCCSSALARAYPTRTPPMPVLPRLFGLAGLALVIPNVQSLTADYYHASSRGQAFGTLWLTISVGGMLGALYATNTAAHSPLGIEGWRFVFFSVALARQGLGGGGGGGFHGMPFSLLT